MTQGSYRGRQGAAAPGVFTLLALFVLAVVSVNTMHGAPDRDIRLAPAAASHLSCTETKSAISTEPLTYRIRCLGGKS